MQEHVTSTLEYMSHSKAILSVLLLSFFMLTAAQTPAFAPGQTWQVYFEGAAGWLVTLEQQTAEGFTGQAESSSYGAPLPAQLSGLTGEDKGFLNLSGDFTGVLLSYPTGRVGPNGEDMLLCALPDSDLASGQAFGLRQESTGLRVIAAGSSCRAEQVTLDSAEASEEAATVSDWPPAVAMGDTWQVSVTQGGAEVAAWTVSLSGSSGATLMGQASGTDARTAEAEFFTTNATQPNMINSWVFALSDQAGQPMYCVFTQDKPFSSDTMTGSVFLGGGASCTATRQ